MQNTMDIKKQLFHLSNLNAKKVKLSTYLNELTTQLTNLTDYEPDSVQLTLYTQLQEQKQSILDNIKKQQNQVNIYNQQKTHLQNLIKNIPSTKTDQIADEQQIYTEEIARINQLIIDNNNMHINAIYNEFDNKKALEQEISNLQTQFAISNSTMHSIQNDSHIFRKSTLTKLNQRKANKLCHQANIDKYNQQIAYINKRIDTLISQNTALQESKDTLIADFYIVDNNQPTNQPTNPLCNIINILKELDLDIDTTNFNTLSLNNKIANLDKYITTNNRTLQILKKQISTLEPPSIPECSQQLQETPLALTNKESFKDRYKHCKIACNILENTLNNSIDTFTYYDKNIVGGIIGKYSNAYNDLQGELTRAEERLSIMLTRIEANFTSKSDNFTTDITALNNQLTNLIILIKNLQEQSTDLDTLITSQYSKITEINDIKLKIENVNQQLCQINIDICAISGNVSSENKI